MDAMLYIHPKSAQWLLWKLFHTDRIRGVKLWLSIGLPISERPLEMLFFANEAGYIGTFYVHERMSDSSESIWFLPEMVEMKQESIYSPQSNNVHAIRIIRSRHLLEQGRPDLSESSKSALSLQIRIQAAILSNDVVWLAKITSEPVFQFSTKLLAFAARYVSFECFRFLMLNHAPFDQKVIEAAAYGGSEEMMQICLEHGCDPITNEVMNESVRGGHTAIVDWLVETHGMKPTTQHLMTALHYSNYEFLIQFASIFDGDITFDPWRKLEYPPSSDYYQFVHYVLNNPRIPETSKNCIKSTVELILLCDDVELVDKCGLRQRYIHHVIFVARNNRHSLLQHISDDIIKSGGHKTALMQCVSMGYFDCVVALLNYGVDINQADCNGSTALVDAAEGGHGKIVRYLVEHGAKIEATGFQGWTPLIYASLFGYTDIVQYLISHGAQLEAGCRYGETALKAAARVRQIDIVKILVEHGANVNVVDTDGMTPLMEVVRYRLHQHLFDSKSLEKLDYRQRRAAFDQQSNQIAQYLIEHGANVNVVGEEGKTILIEAVWSRYTSLVRSLVEYGAELDTPDTGGRTALMYAAANGLSEIVFCLVEHGAQLNDTDEYDETALFKANKYGYNDIAEYLIKHGATLAH